MGIFSAITDIAGKVIEPVSKLIDDLHTSDDEKNQAKIEIQKILAEQVKAAEETARAELDTKKAIIVAEMQQGDNYTKRARPSVVYAGLAMIFINHVLMPMFGKPVIALPAEFWMAWGSVVSIWSIGRSAERRGNGGKLAKKITGGTPLDKILG